MRGKRKSVKRICAVLLAFVMVVAFMPVSDADAAAMSISSSRFIVTSGMTKTLSIKNAWKGASVKWTSTDKSIATVSSKGVVKGVKDGEAVIKCTVSKAGKKRTFKSTVSVKTTKFKATKYYIGTGEIKTLSLIYKYSGAKYLWSSSNKSVVKVSSKGKITGVSSGKATVSVKISIPKKGTRSARTLTKKVTVYVSDSVEVSTQDELDKALKNKSLDQITIKTDEKTEFTIPAGDYGKIDLIVDAPNADVVNNGTFKTITIKQIASDTWTENATGNIFVIDAKAGHIVIPADASISEIKIVNADSSFALDVKGNVEKITIDSTSKVDINISGTVGTIEVNNKATVSVDGTSASPISVAVSDTADGTTINSNVKLDVTTASNTEINLSKGAEGTAVLTSNQDKSVEVTNNTASGVTVKNESGASNTVDAGKNATIDGSGQVTGSTSDNPPVGSGGVAIGGGSAPSGDLTRVVSEFKAIDAVDAGFYNVDLKSVDEIMSLLPQSVIGISNDGEVKYSVESWNNTDGYDADTSIPGYYTFTASLGISDKKASIKEGVKATIEVQVREQYGSIIYMNPEMADCNKFRIVDTIDTGDKLGIKVEYDGNEFITASVSIEYYDASGYRINMDNDFSYFEPQKETTLIFSKYDLSEQPINYSAYILKIFVDSNDQLVPVTDKFQFGIPSEFVEYPYGAERYESKMHVKYDGETLAENSQIISFYWKDDKVIDVNRVYLDHITPHEELDAVLYTTKGMPDKVTLEITGIYARNDLPIYDGTLGEVHCIEESGKEIESKSGKYIFEGGEVLANQLYVRIKSLDDICEFALPTVDYFNESGKKIGESSAVSMEYWEGGGSGGTQYALFEPGKTIVAIFDLPRTSTGEQLDFSGYTIDIVFDGESNSLSLTDHVNIGTPSEVISETVNGYQIYKTSIDVENNSDYLVSDGYALVCFWSGDEMLGQSSFNVTGLHSGECVTKDVYWHYPEECVQIGIPEKATVEYYYARVDKRYSDYNGESGALFYCDWTEEALQKINVMDSKEICDKLSIKMGYLGEKYVGVYADVLYYKNEHLVEVSHVETFMEQDQNQNILFDLPKNSQGDALDFDKYKIVISVCTTSDDYESVLDKTTIDVSYPLIKEENTYSTIVSINCDSASQISGYMNIYYWQGGEIVGIDSKEYDGLPQNGVLEIESSFTSDTVSPDGITVENCYTYRIY